jgi:hypothetical protein
MGSSSKKKRQTQAKRAREQALKERRERKQERKAARRGETALEEVDANVEPSGNE